MCAHRLTTADTSPWVNTGNPPQPHGLQFDDVRVARSILRSLAPAWTFDEHHDPNGIFMLMLTPPGPGDVTPTFVLSQHADDIQVAVALGDSCDKLHTAPNLQRAVRMALSLYGEGCRLIEETTQASARS